MQKTYQLSEEQIAPLIPSLGACIATDKVTVYGQQVSYMIRDNPQNETDSGWVFYGGGESQDYMDNPDNMGVYSLNTIANYDPDIIEFLTYPVGTEIKRKVGRLEVIDTNIAKPDNVFFYPLVAGTNKITQNWQFDVSENLFRLFEKDTLKIWKEGFTILLTTYHSLDNQLEQTIAMIKDTKSVNSHDFEETHERNLTKIRYQLSEETDGKVQDGYYIFGITENEYIQMTIYYDNKNDVAEIEKIWQSLSFSNE